MIETDAPKTWAATRLPASTAWQARFTAPVLAPDAPYLGILPVLVTVALAFLALSGFVLALTYDPRHAYASVQFIDRDVNFGWLIHAFHATGTTMIFGAVFLFLLRTMLNRDYLAPGELVWLLSIGQLALLLVVGYLGYVMADGAVSYWSLTSAAGGTLSGLPAALQSWFFGGPYGGDTLARLAVFHAALALAIFGILALYFIARRVTAAPLGRKLVAFHPYYTGQYFVAFVIFALIFAVLVFFAPHLGENPLNRAAASPLLIPDTVTPPWYLLAIAAVSHALPGALGGIAAVLAGFAVLFALPWLDRGGRAAGPYRVLVFILALDVILLSLAEAAAPSILASIFVVIFTAYYFLHFLVLTPLATGGAK